MHAGVGKCTIEILRNAWDHTGLGKFVFLVQRMLVMWYTTHFFQQEITFGELA